MWGNMFGVGARLVMHITQCLHMFPVLHSILVSQIFDVAALRVESFSLSSLKLGKGMTHIMW